MCCDMSTMGCEQLRHQYDKTCFLISYTDTRQLLFTVKWVREDRAKFTILCLQYLYSHIIVVSHYIVNCIIIQFAGIVWCRVLMLSVILQHTRVFLIGKSLHARCHNCSNLTTSHNPPTNTTRRLTQPAD